MGGGARATYDGSPPAVALVVGHGSRGLGVELARGEGDQFTHCIDMEPVEEATRWHPRIGMATAGRCNRVPAATPSST
jgi:hypothetical protein